MELKQLECNLKMCKELLDIQGQDGNFNTDGYMLGMYNGMELMVATMEGRPPEFRSIIPQDRGTTEPELLGVEELEVEEIERRTKGGTISWT